ncbi:MAG: serine/threonine-protein phosphatase [Bacteroidales bacterium]|nr:serine/threonine-protein phosphatase [Bacteroidales bacterium]
MISIRQPLSFSEIGRKDNQEDYLFPQKASAATRTFILCDGMGGHDNGEVASRTAAEALGEFLSSCNEVDIPTFEAGLEKAYEALDGIGSGSFKKPGTTMACLCLNENSYLVAHIGDSRIYHIRPSLYNPKLGSGGILYQSSDHSLVNDLLKAGELTEEEARDFPQKNVITRAMQPLDKRYKADVYQFDDIREGDYFFICCDGILEQLTNERLCEILAIYRNDSDKLREIRRVCEGRTRDNFSCWLIPVDKVNIPLASSARDVLLANVENIGEPISNVPVASSEVGETAIEPTVEQRNVARKISVALMIDILVAILATCLIVWFFCFKASEAQPVYEQLDQLKPEMTQQESSAEQVGTAAIQSEGNAAEEKINSKEPETQDQSYDATSV